MAFYNSGCPSAEVYQYRIRSWLWSRRWTTKSEAAISTHFVTSAGFFYWTSGQVLFTFTTKWLVTSWHVKRLSNEAWCASLAARFAVFQPVNPTSSSSTITIQFTIFLASCWLRTATHQSGFLLWVLLIATKVYASAWLVRATALGLQRWN